MSLLPTTALPRNLLPTLFQTNDVPLSALQADPRFSYAAFIPDQHYTQPASSLSPKLPLLVTIHGTSRRVSRNIDVWRSFAVEHRCAILAPLFPCLISGPTDIDGYHFLGRVPKGRSEMRDVVLKSQVEVPNASHRFDGGDVRHDLLLLQMLEEVSIRWPGIETGKFFLAGFSGGGQFAHRFLYLHAERLLAVSVGAPGDVTSLDFGKIWPAGVADVESIFELKVDVEALKRVLVMASVGSEDKSESVPKARRQLKGEAFGDDENAHRTRVERLTRLVKQWRVLGMNVEFEIVSGAKHEMEAMHVVVHPFMTKQLERYWGSNGEQHGK